MPLAEARKKALATIIAPAPVRDGMTFQAALTDFLEENYRTSKGRTKAEAKRLLETHFPTLHKSLSSIADDDIAKDLGKLSDRPSEQLHAFRALRVFLKWCTRPPRRYTPHSPLEGYSAPSKDRKGTRVLSDLELKKTWEAAEGSFGAMVKLLILWGCRNGEVGRLKREWVQKDVLIIPGQFTKNGRDHAIPILPMARTVLSEQKSNSAYFFPGRDGHFNDGSWGKAKKALDKVSGVKGYQLRDIRRTFRSNMPKLGVPREISERLINHVTGVQTELDTIYDRYDYLHEKRAALEKWEGYLHTLLAQG